MQHRYTEEQIPHLANGAYQALRNGWNPFGIVSMVIGLSIITINIARSPS